MRVLKKILLVLLVLIFSASLFVLTLDIVSPAENLELKITFDENNYEEGDEIIAAFTAENISSSSVKNIKISLSSPAGYSFSAAGPGSLKSVNELSSGEETTLYAIFTPSESADTAESSGVSVLLSKAVSFVKTNLQLIFVCILTASGIAIILFLIFQKDKSPVFAAVFAAGVLIGVLLPIGGRYLLPSVFRTRQEISVSVSVGDEEITLSGYAAYSNGKYKGSSPETYDVVFYSDGGTVIAPQSVEEGGYAQMPQTPENGDVYFGGWYLDKTASEYFSFNETQITEDTLLYAIWVDDLYFWDSDGDGISDGDETDYGSDPYVADDTSSDTDDDGLADYLEIYVYKTDPDDTDTDGDGLTDYDEVMLTGTDPTLSDTDSDGSNDYDSDADSDGLSNGYEISIGTSPLNSDSDSDTLSDSDEANTYSTDPLNEDTDGDGADDAWEVKNGYDPAAANDTFEISSSASADDGSSASVSLPLSGDPTSLSVEETTAGGLLTEETPGYICTAYDFTADGEFESAEITITYDESLVGEDADLAIFYLNEETQLLEEVETEIADGTATATVTHFSIYILLDRKLLDTVWEEEILSEESEKYTDSEYDIVFVIDYSASMDDNDPDYLRLDIVNEFIEKLRDGQDCGAVVKFAAYATTLASLTTDKDMLANAVSSITNTSSDGCSNSEAGTNGSDGLNSAIQELTGSQGDYKYIIFLTDGEDTEQSYEYEDLIAQAIEQNIVIYSIGMGDADEELLTNIAESTGGKFYYASAVDLEDTSTVGILDAFHDIMISTIDLESDSNNDGISDYYTKLICDGTLKTGTGFNPFEGLTYEEVQANDDYDGDGVVNGEEVIVTYNEEEDRVYMFVISYPMVTDSEGDGIPDDEDTAPLEYGLKGGVLGELTLVSCYNNDNAGWTSGHVFFVYTSYVNGTLDLSGLEAGWSRIDESQDWSEDNYQKEAPSSEYELSAGESVAIGNGANDKGETGSGNISGVLDSISGEVNGVCYNMEACKHITEDYTYLANTYITESVTESDLTTLISYLSRDDVCYWSLTHNCATVACEGWNLIADTQVSPYNMSFLSGTVATPYGLTLYMRALMDDGMLPLYISFSTLRAYLDDSDVYGGKNFDFVGAINK